MANEELNLEDDWADLRPANNIQLVQNRASDIKGQLLLASEKTAYDLAIKFRKSQGEPLTVELLAQVISDGLKLFMEKWLECLRGQDLAGLIEIVLEGQKGRLTPAEMRSFIRALPDSLLEKIAQTALDSCTGIHALMGIEAHRRAGGAEYTLETVLGSVVVTTTTPQGVLTFDLFETFTLPDSIT